MNHKTIVGILTYVPHGLNGEYFFQIGEEEYITVTGDLSKVPRNKKIALCISDNNKVCTHEPFFTVLSI